MIGHNSDTAQDRIAYTATAVIVKNAIHKQTSKARDGFNRGSSRR